MVTTDPRPDTRPAPALVGRTAPPIGVGLPVHNGEPFLARSIESLLAQQDADFELVIADNASTDGTEEICREIARADSRVRYLRRDTNVGVIENHNRIVHETAGEFFSFAAADDEYRADRLAKLSAALRANPDASVAISDAEEIDENGDLIRVWRSTLRTDDPRPHVRMWAKLADPEENLQAYGLIRRSALLRTMLHAPFKGSDRVFITELALNGRFVVVEEPLLRHRIHGQRNSTVSDARTFYANEIGGRNKLYLPNVVEGGWLLRMVRNAPLNRRQRLLAYAALWPWLRRNTIPMARNVARAGVDTARRLRRRAGE